MSVSKHRIYSRLQLAAHHIQKNADRALAIESDITTSQAAVLVAVSQATVQKQRVTQKDIAIALGLNESGITAMVKRLLEMNYLSRKRSIADARAWNLYLTPKGEQALVTVKAPFDGVNSAIEATLSDAEIKQLANYLNRLIDTFRN